MTNKGWECPKCGACYAPTVTKCETCGKVTAVIQDPDATRFTGGGIVDNDIDPRTYTVWNAGPPV